MPHLIRRGIARSWLFAQAEASRNQFGFRFDPVPDVANCAPDPWNSQNEKQSHECGVTPGFTYVFDQPQEM
jgi:hypothetical protein